MFVLVGNEEVKIRNDISHQVSDILQKYLETDIPLGIFTACSLNVWRDIAAMPAVEVVAAACGVLSVWFACGNSIWVYPTGIVSVTLYILICLQVGLYADSLINAYYLFEYIWLVFLAAWRKNSGG